jgi:hypothetical protein
MSIYCWLGFEGAYAGAIQDHFVQHGGWIEGKKWKKNKYLVWLATVWTLWDARNKVVFEGKSVSIHDVTCKIKYLSWSWFSMRVRKRPDVSFEDWLAGLCQL